MVSNTGMGMTTNEMPLLVLDSKIESDSTNHLRIVPHYHGLAGIVGSPQFDIERLEKIIDKIRSLDNSANLKLWLVDLRQETHFYAQGQSLSLYGHHNNANLNKSANEIRQEETQLITHFQHTKNPTQVHVILGKDKGQIHKTKTVEMHLQDSQSEESLAKKLGINYKRFYIPDHQAPSQQTLSEMVKFINQLDHKDWVIVHCRGGKGRTTTFMLLTALLQDKKNHPTQKLKSLTSYATEQVDLGGSNLFDMLDSDASANKQWKQAYRKKRIEFIKQFYQSL